MNSIKHISNLHRRFRKADFFKYTKNVWRDNLTRERQLQKEHNNLHDINYKKQILSIYRDKKE